MALSLYVKKFSHIKKEDILIWIPILSIGGFILSLSFFCLMFSTFNLWVICGGVLVSNLLEYSIHRWPLHQRPKWIPSSYKVHSGIHHRLFSYNQMEYTTIQDISQIVTSPINVFSLITLGGLFSSVIALIFGYGIGLLLFGVMLMYYLIYEIIHYSTHVPSHHWMRRMRVLDGFYHHHKEHHRTKSMRKGNFNVTIPLFDVVFESRLTLKE